MVEPITTNIVARLLDAFLGMSGGPLARIISNISVEVLGLQIGVAVGSPVDQRLARLDDARSALAESLTALDELHVEAERSKAEHARARAALEKALSSKKDAEHQLAEVRAIMAGEVSAFQIVAGVTDVRKERLIGFFNGILSSAAFAIIIAGAGWLLTRFQLLGHSG